MFRYISDCHFGSYNIIKRDNLPFSSVKEMDLYMIHQWNKVVCPDDDVFIVGDFIDDEKMAEFYFKSLKGRLHLVTGNHDLRLLKHKSFRKKFESIDSIKTINDGEKIILCHYPMAEWDGYQEGTIHIYGHIHNHPGSAQTYMAGVERAYNVYARKLDYKPVRLQELQGSMKGL